MGGVEGASGTGKKWGSLPGLQPMLLSPPQSPPDFMQNAKRKENMSLCLLGDLAGDA